MRGTSTDAERFRTLCDRDEITRILNQFCRGLDRCDEAAIAACFHPDGYDDHGSVKGLGSEVATALVAGVRDYWKMTWHSTTNCDIELDGDVAAVESYVTSVNQRDSSAGILTAIFAGRYVDRFERRDGRWAIARRTVVLDWGVADHFGPYKGDLTVFVQGRRDRSDISYEERPA